MNMRERAAMAPRVLELKGIVSYDGAVYIEYRDRPWVEVALFLYERETEPKLSFASRERMIFSMPADQYGVTWRCWTKRPSESVMVTTRWAA